jgi:hypothetical protein
MRERAAALKHDLGKYVAWRSANLAEAAWSGPVTDELVEALHADLLTTRKAASRSESAWEVWARLTSDLPRPLEQPELVTVEEAVEALRSFEAALRDGDREALAAGREQIRAAQTRIRDALRDFHRRMLSESRESSEG